MATTKLPPVHPGEILREEFLEPMGITAREGHKRAATPHQ